jgi:GT2 family glycosyltransferase
VSEGVHEHPATIVVVTKDRVEEARTAIASAVAQACEVEVLVIDDGSDDGTFERVRTEFPQVRLYRSAESEGYIVQRNRAAELARSPIIFSIDDDAEFLSPATVASTIAEFDDPRVGAVAIPVIDGPGAADAPPGGDEVRAVAAYSGTAHAVRRDVFLALGGYRASLEHWGEERDFCLRLLQAGFITRLGRAGPIAHRRSLRREQTGRMTVLARRNDVLHAWANVPMPYLPVHLAGAIAKGSWIELREGSVRDLLRGYARAARECRTSPGLRRPVPPSIYRLHRRLQKHGSLPLGQVEALLPSTASID